MHSCWHDLLFLFLSPTVLSFSSFHGLVVWGWGLWTDSVFSLSRPCIADSKEINNNNSGTNSSRKKDAQIRIIIIIIISQNFTTVDDI